MKYSTCCVLVFYKKSTSCACYFNLDLDFVAGTKYSTCSLSLLYRKYIHRWTGARKAEEARLS